MSLKSITIKTSSPNFNILKRLCCEWLGAGLSNKFCIIFKRCRLDCYSSPSDHNTWSKRSLLDAFCDFSICWLSKWWFIWFTWYRVTSWANSTVPCRILTTAKVAMDNSKKWSKPSFQESPTAQDSWRIHPFLTAISAYWYLRPNGNESLFDRILILLGLGPRHAVNIRALVPGKTYRLRENGSEKMQA